MQFPVKVQTVDDSKKLSSIYPNLCDLLYAQWCVKVHMYTQQILYVCSEFVRGIGSAPPHITPNRAVNLLRKSVAQICRHQGYNRMYNLYKQCYKYKNLRCKPIHWDHIVFLPIQKDTNMLVYLRYTGTSNISGFNTVYEQGYNCMYDVICIESGM